MIENIYIIKQKKNHQQDNPIPIQEGEEKKELTKNYKVK